VVPDASYVAAARREVENLARRIGLDEDDRGRASLVATELATNLARHARGLLKSGAPVASLASRKS